ncbi:MAG: helix-turn-helix domain-containing protein [Bacteroidota bacterium]
MEVILIPMDQYKELLSKVNSIYSRVEKIASSPQDNLIDNVEFIRRLKISKRTAQTWRNQKRIAYSQIGAKIYYRNTDVENLLKLTSNQASEPSPQKTKKSGL